MSLMAAVWVSAVEEITGGRWPAQESPVKFAFLTDLHYSAGSGSVNDLSRCVKDVNTSLQQ